MKNAQLCTAWFSVLLSIYLHKEAEYYSIAIGIKKIRNGSVRIKLRFNLCMTDAMRSKSMGWFLYDNGLRHERFNKNYDNAALSKMSDIFQKYLIDDEDDNNRSYLVDVSKRKNASFILRQSNYWKLPLS